MRPIWKILIIDDTAPLAELIAMSFRKLGGYEVHTECKPLRAMRRIKMERPDLIILDLRMPGMDGFEILDDIRTEGLTTPVIACSSVITPWDVRKAYEAGCNSFIQKPTCLDGFNCMAEQIIAYWNLNVLPAEAESAVATNALLDPDYLARDASL